MTRNELRDYLAALLKKGEEDLERYNKKQRESNLIGGFHPNMGESIPERYDVEIKLSVLREVVAFLSVQSRSAAQAATDKKNGGVRRGRYAIPKKKVS